MGLEVVGPAAGPGLSCMTTAEGDRDAYSIPSRFFYFKNYGREHHWPANCQDRRGWPEPCDAIWGKLTPTRVWSEGTVWLRIHTLKTSILQRFTGRFDGVSILVIHLLIFLNHAM